jgi:hypothetical protein
MRNSRFFVVSQLPTSDLFLDAVYQGGRKGNAGDDPLPALLKVSTQGGFRYRGNLENLELVVLTSTLSDPDWPDALDTESGTFTYFGDNKHPGRSLHETPRNGNQILKRVFELAHSDREGRKKVPPILVFSKSGQGRDVVFLGLAVPGSPGLRPSEDLVALWKSSQGRRFQNYRAQFTVLDVAVISRTWIMDILNGTPHSENAPRVWEEWVETGRYRPLLAVRSIEYRTKREQLPNGEQGLAMINTVRQFFGDDWYSFEKCAAAMVRLMLPEITSLDLTRPSRDGGRDATGGLRIGIGAASIVVEFALEAKCYGISNPVGVREISRLISRLRHRQFGILVTTSYVDTQAYKEIKEDQHPIIVISALDIVDLLRSNGLGDVTAVMRWLALEFSQS